MQAASVLEHQRAVFGLVDQGSTSPFAKVVFHLPVTPFDPALAKSGRDAPRVVGVIVVVAAAGIAASSTPLTIAGVVVAVAGGAIIMMDR